MMKSKNKRRHETITKKKIEIPNPHAAGILKLFPTNGSCLGGNIQSIDLSAADSLSPFHTFMTQKFVYV